MRKHSATKGLTLLRPASPHCRPSTKISPCPLRVLLLLCGPLPHPHAVDFVGETVVESLVLGFRILSSFYFIFAPNSSRSFYFLFCLSVHAVWIPAVSLFCTNTEPWLTRHPGLRHTQVNKRPNTRLENRKRPYSYDVHRTRTNARTREPRHANSEVSRGSPERRATAHRQLQTQRSRSAHLHICTSPSSHLKHHVRGGHRCGPGRG